MDENVESQEMSKSSKFWGENPVLAECFLELCHVEVGREGFSGSSLKATSWKKISEGIEDSFGVKLEQKALKNRFDLEKKRFNLWKDIIRGTGGGFNLITGEINWDDNKWTQVLKTNSKVKMFRGHPLKNCELLHKVFDGVSAKGVHRHASAQEDMPSKGDGFSERDEVEETLDATFPVGDSYWEDLSIDGEQYHAPSQPTHGSTSVMLPESSSRPKKRKKKNDDDDDIATVVKLLDGQFDFMKEEKEIKRANEAAQKLEDQSCSLIECIGVLNMLKALGLINDGHTAKAMVPLVKEREFRKTLMGMEKVEDKEDFVKSLAMI